MDATIELDNPTTVELSRAYPIGNQYRYPLSIVQGSIDITVKFTKSDLESLRDQIIDQVGDGKE